MGSRAGWGGLLFFGLLQCGRVLFGGARVFTGGKSSLAGREFGAQTAGSSAPAIVGAIKNQHK